MGYVDLKYRPSQDDLVCLYRIKSAHGYTVTEVADHVAGESSTGTWTDVSTMEPGVKKLGAKVFYVRDEWAKIAYPGELFEPGNMPQILSSIAGNVFGMKSVASLRLQDVRWPRKLIKSFLGPRLG
ncbi:MAG: ribulose-bisphosphate carboxylase large subunit, partial [Candidatus Aenigmatarchaeota archaeon]